MLTLRIGLVLLWLALALPAPAFAWHKEGHMAVARTAWYQLEDKHKTRLAVLLKAHPHYEIYLSAERPDKVSEVEWAFVRAATWPDWVREPRAKDLSPDQQDAIKKQFNTPAWHFINLPYLHPADVDRFDAAALRKKALTPEFDDADQPRHAAAALKQNLSRLQSADTSDETKAISLCWLLHLVGDLHQPLHAATLIASKDTFDPPFLPPGGDQGGNKLVVKLKPTDKSAMTLHTFWDALIFRDKATYAQVDEIVTGWLKDAKFRRDQLPELKETEYLTWAEESFELAKTVAYRGDDGFLKARSLPKPQRADQKLDLKGLTAPAFPDGYEQKAEKVAARRLVVAGYRLADQLQRALKEVK